MGFLFFYRCPPLLVGFFTPVTSGSLVEERTALELASPSEEEQTSAESASPSDVRGAESFNELLSTEGFRDSGRVSFPAGSCGESLYLFLRRCFSKSCLKLPSFMMPFQTW